MSDAPIAVITDVTDLDVGPARRILEDAGFEVHVLALDADPTIPDAARGAVIALAGYAFLGGEFFDALPALRYIGTASAGIDMVDAAEAAARGVVVQPLVGVATEEVAAHALALLLAVERGVLPAAAAVSAGAWSEAYEAVPRRLSERTLGLFGLGRIGGRLAQLARPLFARVIAHDPYLTAAPAGVDELVDAAALLAASDVLSLHVPLTAETAGVIGASELAALPEGASVVNVSRGELIDSAALIAALDAGSLRGAAVDVLDAEPPAADHPMRTHPRVIVTPHIAYLSERSLEGYEQQPARSAVAWWQAHLAAGAPQT
ncbi:NAD(P)-dependent oxidoreductase [Microbacterium sp. TNHR37B]|uniref:NAD(P)-dependent oxidoreductase n=1 Tax=Microbacterium sp. TNHR37B TaxID=1775956 RepID=UPI0007B2BB00|nr:NAD(P)-dependent oxidoreductase [Microbacterium sp. TNHR37B]KZE89861.1 Glycerate dehydrogenase [Microbacterium sp. TNHR37B]